MIKVKQTVNAMRDNCLKQWFLVNACKCIAFTASKTDCIYWKGMVEFETMAVNQIREQEEAVNAINIQKQQTGRRRCSKCSPDIYKTKVNKCENQWGNN